MILFLYHNKRFTTDDFYKKMLRGLKKLTLRLNQKFKNLNLNKFPNINNLDI